jgi:hypothetical protein
MTDLKQSTAVTVKLGPFVDATDGSTAETALTIQKADVRLSKNGGNMAAASADQGASDAGAPHDELGDYDISLDATDTATLGRLRVLVKEAGALVVWRDFMVQPANVWDSLYGADKLQVDAAEASGDVLTTLKVLVPLITTVTITNQTTGVLAAGSADNNAYKDWKAFYIDQSTATQVCLGHVAGYVGSTRTYTLKLDPGIFTVATGDTIALVPPGVTFGLSEQAAAFAAINVHIDLFTTNTGNLLATAEPGSFAEQVSTLIELIKTVTDKFAFTVANQVNANTKSVNGTAVSGAGTEGDPWGPA